MSRSLRPFAIVLLSASVASSFAGCSPKAEQSAATRSAAREEEREIDRDDILDDRSMTDEQGMTVADVQSFLERTPYGRRSVLASYRPKGKAAAQIIVETAREYSINPMLILVRAQLEQGLVSKTSASDRILERALGCGCTDAARSEAADAQSAHTCSAQYRGFENQARCAASTLRKALDALAGAKRATRSGWAKGKPKTTLDGIVVTPRNDATAALYSYTPWVGKLGGGRASVGGTSAHWKIWNDFDGAQHVANPGDPSSRPGNTEDPASEGLSCEGRCAANEVCSDTGTCVAGCRVNGATDSCPPGRRCDRSDGLVGTCEQETCTCPVGTFCGTGSTEQQCVQCSPSDTTNCRAEDEGDACVTGHCGCRTSADCGYDRSRICDPIRGVCMEDPFPRGSGGAPPEEGDAGPEGPAIPGDPSSGSNPDESTSPSEPDLEPAPTPDLPESAPEEERESAGNTKREQETIELPSRSASSGCNAAAGPTGHGVGTWALGLALTAALRRRRASVARSTEKPFTLTP